MGIYPIRPFDADWLLSLFCIAGFVVVILLFRADMATSSVRTGDRVQIGVAVDSMLDVRRRSANELVWNRLESKNEIYNHDTLFIGEASSAKIRLQDGSELEIDENTLLVLSRNETKTSAKAEGNYKVGMRSGTLRSQLSRQSLEIKSEHSFALLQPNTEAFVQSDQDGIARLEVAVGSAMVVTGSTSQEVKSRQVLTAKADKEEATVETLSARLIEPAFNQRLSFTDVPPTMALKWKVDTAQKAYLEIAQDKQFKRRIFKEAVKTNGKSFQPSGEGTHWWRLVSATGRVISETRSFRLVKSRAPELNAPTPGGVVLVPKTQRLNFMWAAVPGAYRYRIQVATEPHFRRLLADVSVRNTRFMSDRVMQEGFYYWRVRVDEAWMPDAPFSEATEFRLIQKPIPQAPALLKTEFTVDDE